MRIMSCRYRIALMTEDRNLKIKTSVKCIVNKSLLRKKLHRSCTKAAENFVDKQNIIIFSPAQNHLRTVTVSIEKWNTTITLDQRKFFMVLREWKRPMKSNLIMASKKQRCLRYWKDIPGLAVCLLRSPNKMVHKKIPIFLCNISRSEHTCWKNYFNNYRRNDFPIKYHTTIIGRVYQRLKDCELKCSLKEMSHCNAISNSIKKLGIMRRRLNYDIGQGFLSSREKLLSSECSEGHNIEFNRSVQLNMLEILESREIRIFSLDRKVAAI